MRTEHQLVVFGWWESTRGTGGNACRRKIKMGPSVESIASHKCRAVRAGTGAHTSPVTRHHTAPPDQRGAAWSGGTAWVAAAANPAANGARCSKDSCSCSDIWAAGRLQHWQIRIRIVMAERYRCWWANQGKTANVPVARGVLRQTPQAQAPTGQAPTGQVIRTGGQQNAGDQRSWGWQRHQQNEEEECCHFPGQSDRHCQMAAASEQQYVLN